MKPLRRFWQRLRGSVARAPMADIATEIESHVRMQTDDNIRAGMSASEARRAAMLKFGSMGAVKERYRDERTLPLLTSIVNACQRDFRDAVRSLVKAPGYTTAAIVTLTLAVGANSAIFSIVYAVLLRPLAIAQPQELVLAWGTNRQGAASIVEISYRDFESWATKTKSFAQGAAIGSSLWPAVLRGHGEPSRVSTAGVSMGFFETLGVSALLGRGLEAGDDTPNAPAVTVLSYATWVGRFGGEPGAIGRTIELDRTRTIVGVMPKGFEYPRGADFWIPVRPILAGVSAPGLSPLEDIGVLLFLGRLDVGVSRHAAALELQSLVNASATPGATPHLGKIAVTPFIEHTVGPLREGLWALWAAVALLLAIACANISGLMLTRVAVESHQYAVRLALGATRWQLYRLWSLQALVLACVSGVLGWLTSGVLLRSLVALAPGDVPRLADASMTPTVGAFTVAVVFCVALVCGTGPARHASRATIVDVLQDASRATPGRRTQRLRSTLVVLQIALAVVLLMSAGVVVRSFVALRMLDLGFITDDVVTLFVQAKSNTWMTELVTRLEHQSIFSAAGAVYLRPLELGPVGDDASVVLEGQIDNSRTRQGNPVVNHQVATPGYFRAMRIRLIRGRTFSDDDTAASPRVALVSEATAQRLWPGADAIGKRLLLPTDDPTRPSDAWRTVVGVVGNVRYRGLDDLRLDVYDAALQSARTTGYLVVRSTVDLPTTVAAVRSEVRRLDPSVVVDSVSTLDSVVARAMAPWRFSAWLLALFAGLGFVLSAIGLFGMVSIDVEHRRRELAVRAALGAGDVELLRAVLVPAAFRVCAGLMIGALFALGATRGLRAFLVDVTPMDPLTWIAGSILVIVVVGAAAYVPARRAARVDPLVLLRRG